MKDIKNFEGYYQISNLRRVKSLDRNVIANKNGGIKILKGTLMKLTRQKGRDEKGYMVVNLRKEGKNKVSFVHRLVAEAFIPNYDNKNTVNHIDGDKSNNNINNLEWSTYSENNKYAIDNGLRHPRSRGISQYDLQGNFIRKYKSIAEASILNNYGRCSISNCLNKRQYSYKGYIWKYNN